MSITRAVLLFWRGETHFWRLGLMTKASKGHGWRMLIFHNACVQAAGEAGFVPRPQHCTWAAKQCGISLSSNTTMLTTTEFYAISRDIFQGPIIFSVLVC